MNPIIEFKDPKLKSEFEVEIDSRLQIIIYALAGMIYYSYGKSLLITELMRTQAMQDFYYKDNPDYKIKPWQSVHQYGRGADISLKFFTDTEIKVIGSFLVANFNYSGNFSTALIHDTGFGEHLHIQVDSDNKTEIVKIR